MDNTFGDWLRLQIEEQTIPRRRFADLVGVGKATLYDWLAGRAKPRGVNVVRMARALKIDRAIIDEKLSGQVAA